MEGTQSTLEQFDVLLNATTNDELLELIMRTFEVGASRLENYYADDEDAEPAPVDIINEGLVFLELLDDLTPMLSDNARACAVGTRLRNAKTWLLEDRVRAAKGLPRSPRTLHRPRPQTVASPAGPVAPRLQLDDERAILAAVTEASRQRDDRFAEIGRERPQSDGVAAREVARILAGLPRNSSPDELAPAHGDVIRVGRVLGRLARDGQLRVVSKRYEHGATRYVKE